MPKYLVEWALWARQIVEADSAREAQEAARAYGFPLHEGDDGVSGDAYVMAALAEDKEPDYIVYEGELHDPEYVYTERRFAALSTLESKVAFIVCEGCGANIELESASVVSGWVFCAGCNSTNDPTAYVEPVEADPGQVNLEFQK